MNVPNVPTIESAIAAIREELAEEFYYIKIAILDDRAAVPWEDLPPEVKARYLEQVEWGRDATPSR